MSKIITAVIGVVAIVVGSIYDQPWLVKLGAVLLLNAASQALTPGPGRPPVQPVDVAYSGTLEPRRILYGKMKIAGMHCIPPLTSGQNNDYFHLMLALAGHPITGIDDVYADQVRIDTADIAPVTYSTGDGLVSANVTANGYAGKLWIRRYTGSETIVDTILHNNFAAWDNNHLGKGIAKLAVQAQFDSKVFTSGVPQFTCMARGKLVYDPRKDSTNGGSGTQRNLSPSTWAYSTNPALCLRDYLTDALGLGESQARIDDVLVAAAANKCDELCTVPIPILVGLTSWIANSRVVTGQNTAFLSVLRANYWVVDPTGALLQIASVDSDTQFTLTANYTHASYSAQVTQYNSTNATQVTQSRYTCNTLLDCTARAEDNITQLATAMMGRCFMSSGKWRMYAGGFTASDFDLDETDLVGGVSIQASTPRTDLYNAVRGNFIDPQKNYSGNEFPAILNATFEAEDGERIYTETNFACCTDRYECQRNAMVLSNQSRNRHVVSAQFGMSAYKIRPFMTGLVTIEAIGWEDQSVRCTSWRMYPNGIIELVLQEAYVDDWDDPLINQYNISGVNTAPPALAYIPYPPTGLTFISLPSGIQIVVTLPAQVVGGTTVQVFEGLVATAFADGTATNIAEGASTTFLIGKRDTTSRYYWCRTKGPNGQVSPTFPSGNGKPMNADTIRTADIADQAITNNKIQDGTIAATKFVSGLQLIQIVASLPALPNANYPPGNSFVYLSTNNQLYSNVGNVWQSMSSNPAGSITTTQIADGAITTPKLASNSVTTNNLVAGAVTAAKCVTNMIVAGSGIIADAAITNANIGDLQVNNAKIANLTVGTGKIADGAITGIGLGTGNSGTLPANTDIISFNYTTSGGSILLQTSVVGATTTSQSTFLSLRVNNSPIDSYNVTQSGGNLAPNVNFRWNGMYAYLSLAAGTYTFSIQTGPGGINATQAPILALFEYKK